MKRFRLYLLLLAAALGLGLFSAQGTDAAQLLPARVLLVDASGGVIRLRTDQGQTGLGASLDEAMRDLQAGAPGEVFFGTVDDVILTERAWYLLPQLVISRELRPSAALIRAQTALDAEQAARFLSAHRGQLTLQRARAALLYGQQPEAPTLLQTEGGLRLAG